MEFVFAFNTDIVNFVPKNDKGEAENIVLLIFVLWWCFNSRWMGGGGMGQKSYLGPTEIASFSSCSFSRSNKHDTF